MRHDRSDRRVWSRAFAALAAVCVTGGGGLTAAQAAQAAPPGVTVAGLHGVTAVSGGIGFSLALLNTGRVFAWGVNNVGQLGDGTTTNRSTPVQVRGLSHVKAISAGGFSSVALLGNGRVMAWGDDQVGQLGNGVIQTDSTVPVKVSNLSGVTAVSAGLAHNLALLPDQTVMAWGFNRNGQLGNGNVGTNSALPVAVRGLTGVAAVSAGGQHSLALLKTGHVMSWGSNSNAQLGTGSINPPQSAVPVAVTNLHGVTALAAGGFHSLALLASGAVMAWGDDQVGELGNGVNPPFSTVPVRVQHLAKATAVSASDTLDAGASYSLALLPGQTVDDWGATNPPTELPRAVAGATTVTAISPNVFLLANGTVTPFAP
jgi:alpha-tubulin suppressor-like RCC1 family protein